MLKKPLNVPTQTNIRGIMEEKEEKLNIHEVEDLSTLTDEQLFAIVDDKDFGKKMPPVAKKERRTSRKTFQSIAQQLLSLAPPKQVTNQILKLSPDLRREDVDVRLAMLQMQIYNALKGDAKAFELVRDTAGEKPSDNLHIESEAPIIQVSDSQIAMVIQQINQLAGD